MTNKPFQSILTIICFSLFICSLNTNTVYAAKKSYALKTVKNKFIKIVVNDSDSEKGRFAIETIEGDLSRKEDNRQPLIYGRPKPWTSYTTLMIDGKTYGFGGPTKRRSGKTLTYSKQTTQTVSKNAIITTSTFDKVSVSQKLSIYRSPITRVNDTALIHYRLKNNDSVTHNIGLRLMMDTLLGSNDGAPFRIGSKSYTFEKSFEKDSLMPFWQSFDRLSSPNVIAQGVLSLEDQGIYPPNRMVLVNWGTLADSPWDFKYEEGRAFVRKGELEKDTALAMYWNPVSIPPGGTYDIRTLLGLGGVSLSPGELSLGLTSPEELSTSAKSDFLIVAYIQNTGGFDSEDTVVKLSLPNGIQLLGDQSLRQSIGTLSPGESRQIAYRIKATKKAALGKSKVQLSVLSSSLPENSLERPLEITGPPRLNTAITYPKETAFEKSKYIDFTVKLHNPEKNPLSNILLSISPDEDLILPPFETSTKTVPYLSPGEAKEINWKLKLKDSFSEVRKIDYSITSKLTDPISGTKKLTVTDQSRKFFIRPSSDNIKRGSYFYVRVGVRNIDAFQNLRFVVEYDQAGLSFLRYSEGSWLIESGQTGRFVQKRNRLFISRLNHTGGSKQLNIAKIHFKAMRKGTAVVKLYKGTEVVALKKIRIE